MTKMLLPVLCGLFGCTLSANALFFIEPPVSYPSIDTAASLSFGVDLDSSLADRSSTTPFSDFDGGGTIDYTPNVSIMVTFNDPSSDAIYITALLGLNDIGPIHGTITPVGGPGQFTITYLESDLPNAAVPEGGNTLLLLSLAFPALMILRRRGASASV
jgi:hypothetical protein